MEKKNIHIFQFFYFKPQNCFSSGVDRRFLSNKFIFFFKEIISDQKVWIFYLFLIFQCLPAIANERNCAFGEFFFFFCFVLRNFLHYNEYLFSFLIEIKNQKEKWKFSWKILRVLRFRSNSKRHVFHVFLFEVKTKEKIE